MAVSPADKLEEWLEEEKRGRRKQNLDYEDLAVISAEVLLENNQLLKQILAAQYATHSR